MPPNTKGGKGYKKHKTGDSEEVVFIDIQPQQYIARAVRILGNRNVLCYCHDNITRICHICRRMKGHSADKKIELGDIVLVSLRDFSSNDVSPIKRGDIIAKYPLEQVKYLKRVGSYPKLFMKLEEKEGIVLENIGEKVDDKIFLTGINEDGYTFETDEEEGETEEEKEEETKIVDKRERVSHRKGGREIREGNVIQQDEKEINVDDL